MAGEKERGGPQGYPPGYEGLYEIIRETRARIAELDRKIDALPPNRGYIPTPRPRGAEFSTRKPGSFEINFDSLVERQEQIIAEALARIEELTTDGDRETNRAVRQHARDNLFTREELSMDRGPLDEVQDRMAKRITSKRERTSIDGPTEAKADAGPIDARPNLAQPANDNHVGWTSRLSFTIADVAPTSDIEKSYVARHQDVETPIADDPWFEMGERHWADWDVMREREREALAQFDEQHLDMTPDEQIQRLELRLSFMEEREKVVSGHYMDVIQHIEEMLPHIEETKLDPLPYGKGPGIEPDIV